MTLLATISIAFIAALFGPGALVLLVIYVGRTRQNPFGDRKFVEKVTMRFVHVGKRKPRIREIV